MSAILKILNKHTRMARKEFFFAQISLSSGDKTNFLNQHLLLTMIFIPHFIQSFSRHNVSFVSLLPRHPCKDDNVKNFFHTFVGAFIPQKKKRKESTLNFSIMYASSFLQKLYLTCLKIYIFSSPYVIYIY